MDVAISGASGLIGTALTKSLRADGHRVLRLTRGGVTGDDTYFLTGTDEHGAYVELRFTLPPGCYATALLRELGKSESREGPPEELTAMDGG